jgi:hypothetical protein
MERGVPATINLLAYINVQFHSRYQSGDKLDSQIPNKGKKPGSLIYADTTQRNQAYGYSPDVSHSRGENCPPIKGCIAEPFGYNVSRPNKQTGDRPYYRHANQSWFQQQQTNTEQNIPDIAHPQQVTQLINLPVVNCLGEEEQEG